jgi:hypothetical protein
VAYVEAPLCTGAKQELENQGARTGSVRVRIACLPGAEDGKRLDLAAIGANARRATEDAAGIGYLEVPATPSFSRPIVEAAGLAVVRDASGVAAMRELLSAVEEAGDSGSLRESVRGSVG